MSLRINAANIDIVTRGPVCGAHLRFTDGLNVLRANNSSGKSTCLQAIIYALGLEGMLGARRDVPLPHSVTDRLMIAGEELLVLESSVTIEIANGSGEVMTLRRAIKSDADDRSLIRSWNGAAITGSGQGLTEQDYFVRRAGAAQREAGFHSRLAQFLGWTLPRVSKYDGSEVPLYLECIFPFFYVEQKHGWTGVQARMPSYLGIRDVSTRSTEFVLSLDAYQKALDRQRLMSAAAEIESEWKSVTQSIKTLCDSTGIVPSNLALTPAANVGDDVEIRCRIWTTDAGWVPVDQRLAQLRQQLDAAQATVVPTVRDNAEELEAGLAEAQRTLDDAIVRLRLAQDQLRSYTTQRDNLDVRIEALREDLQRHRDSRLLAQLGSSIATSPGELTVCPTCHQDLHDGMDIAAHVMTIDESIAHIDRQIVTFSEMRADVARAVEAEAAAVRTQRIVLADLRAQIRAHSDALVGPSGAPSLATVTARVTLQQSLSQLGQAIDELARMQSALVRLSHLWATNRARLGEQDSGPSPSDRAKIDYFENSLRDQLAQYEFDSLRPTDIDISRETYRPIHEGFDLGFDLSASDMVRLIWSYLLGVLDTSKTYSARHPGLLIFDEPRQQDTAQTSFAALLRRSSEISEGAQMLIATSESSTSLESMLTNVPHTVIDFPAGERILQPLEGI